MPRIHRKPEVVKAKSVDMSNGIEWRATGCKQKYKFPQDLTGPEKRIDPRCNRCEKTVYSAEKLSYEQIPYHRDCVRCFQCNKKLGNADATPFGETDFLCNDHFARVVGEINRLARKNVSKGVESSAFVKSNDMGPGIEWKKSGKKQVYKYPEDLKKSMNLRCNLCGKTSYPAETVTYNQIPYHAFCFRCLRCGKKLSAGEANPFGDSSYLCNNHFENVIKFVGVGLTSQDKKRPSNVPEPKTYPKDEFGTDLRMYDGYAWRVEKGKQTYKYPEDLEKAKKVPRCNLCGLKCYPAETITYEKIPYHVNCIRCLKCGKKLFAANATPFGEDVFLCDSHFEQYGQGKGLPHKTKPLAAAEVADENEEDLSHLSAIERRRRRKQKAKT